MEIAVVWKAFVEYGILAILCFLEGLAIIRLWKDNNALRDRYEAKSDKSAEKITTLAARAQAAADVLEELREERRRARSVADVEPNHR